VVETVFSISVMCRRWRRAFAVRQGAALSSVADLNQRAKVGLTLVSLAELIGGPFPVPEGRTEGNLVRRRQAFENFQA